MSSQSVSALEEAALPAYGIAAKAQGKKVDFGSPFEALEVFENHNGCTSTLTYKNSMSKYGRLSLLACFM